MLTKNLRMLVLMLTLLSTNCWAEDPIPFAEDIQSLQVSIEPAGNILAIGLLASNAVEGMVYNAKTKIWTSSGNLSTGTASDPVIKSDDKGNAIAAWFQGTEVWASYYDGLTKQWTTPQQISCSTIDTTATAQIGFFDNAGGMVAWAATDGTYFVESSIFEGGIWSQCAQTVGQPGAISEVSLGTTNSGHALAFWIHQDTLFGAIYHPSTFYWGMPQSFSDPLNTKAQNLVLSSSSTGPSVASWLVETPGPSYGLALLSLSIPLVKNQYLSYMIEDLETPYQFYHQLAVFSNGNSVHLWQKTEGTELVIKANSINIVSGAGSDIVELSEYSPPVFLDPQLQLAVDNHGNAIGTWVESSDTTQIKQAKYSFQEGTWGSAEVIYDGDASIDSLTLSATGFGNFAMGWIESGSALFAFDNIPATPTNFTVYEIVNRFPFQSEHSHQLNWNPSTSPDVVEYRIYKGSTLLATVPSSTTDYRVHNCPAGVSVTYNLYSVTAQGIESLAATVTFNP